MSIATAPVGVITTDHDSSSYDEFLRKSFKTLLSDGMNREDAEYVLYYITVFIDNTLAEKNAWIEYGEENPWSDSTALKVNVDLYSVIDTTHQVIAARNAFDSLVEELMKTCESVERLTTASKACREIMKGV